MEGVQGEARDSRQEGLSAGPHEAHSEDPGLGQGIPDQEELHTTHHREAFSSGYFRRPMMPLPLCPLTIVRSLFYNLCRCPHSFILVLITEGMFIKPT